jgi:hypothetical protein
MVSEENVTEEPNVFIVYKTYTPALKKAQQKYYEANKQKIIDRNVNYYRGKKDTEEYKKQKAIYNKTYNEKKKLLKQQQEQQEEQNNDAH